MSSFVTFSFGRFRTAFLALLLLFSFATCPASSQDSDASHSVVPLKKFARGQWVEKVWGDASRSGEPFVIRIHNDAGYIVLPHFHLIDENITVVQGSWALGMGKRFNRSELEPMELGTFGLAPKDMPHFAFSKTETISAGARNWAVFVHAGRSCVRA